MRRATQFVTVIAIVFSTHWAHALTPQDIIALTLAGQSPAQIIEAIKNDPAASPIDVAQILALKNAGVADQVLQYLVKQSQPPPPKKETPKAPVTVKPVITIGSGQKTPSKPKKGACPHCKKPLLLPADFDAAQQVECASCGGSFNYSEIEKVQGSKQPRSYKKFNQYGWKIALVDLSTVGLLITGLKIGTPSIGREGSSLAADILVYTAYTSFFLGGPITHVIHKNISGALASLGARVVIPAAGLGLGLGLAAGCDHRACGLAAFMLGAAIGVGGAITYDVFYLAETTQLVVLPPVSFQTHPNAHFAGLESKPLNTWGLGFSSRF